MSTKNLNSIIGSLSNTSLSFEEYANRVKKIIDELENCKNLTRETKDCASKISTLEKENVKLNDKINKIVEKNTETLDTIELTNKSEYELLKRKYDALNKEIDKLHNERSIEMTDVTHNDILKNINQCRTMSTGDKKELLTRAKEFISLSNSKTISDKGMQEDLRDIGNKIKEKCYDTSIKPTKKLGGKSRKQRKSRKSKMTRRVHK